MNCEKVVFGPAYNLPPLICVPRKGIIFNWTLKIWLLNIIALGEMVDCQFDASDACIARPFGQDSMFAMFCSNTIQRYQISVLYVIIAALMQMWQHPIFINFHNVYFSWRYFTRPKPRQHAATLRQHILLPLCKIASTMIPVAAFFINGYLARSLQKAANLVAVQIQKMATAVVAAKEFISGPRVVQAQFVLLETVQFNNYLSLASMILIWLELFKHPLSPGRQ